MPQGHLKWQLLECRERYHCIDIHLVGNVRMEVINPDGPPHTGGQGFRPLNHDTVIEPDDVLKGDGFPEWVDARNPILAIQPITPDGDFTRNAYGFTRTAGAGRRCPKGADAADSSEANAASVPCAVTFPIIRTPRGIWATGTTGSE